MIFLLQTTQVNDYNDGKPVRKLPLNGLTESEIIIADGKVVLDDKNRPTFKGIYAATYKAMIEGGNFILIEEADDDPLTIEKETTTIKTRKKREKKNEFDQGIGTDSGDSGDSEDGDTDGGADTED